MVAFGIRLSCRWSVWCCISLVSSRRGTDYRQITSYMTFECLLQVSKRMLRTLQINIKLCALQSARRIREQLTPYSPFFRDNTVSIGSIDCIITFDETSDVGEVPDTKGRIHNKLRKMRSGTRQTTYV